MSISALSAAGTAAIAQQVQTQQVSAPTNASGDTPSAGAAQQGGRPHHHHRTHGSQGAQTTPSQPVQTGSTSISSGTLNTVA